MTHYANQPVGQRPLTVGRVSHPPLTGGYVDRDAATRMSEATLDAAWAEPETRLLRVRGGLLALGELSDDAATLDLVPVTGERDAEPLYLGRAEGAAVFAADMTGVSATETSESELSAFAANLPEPRAGWVHPFEFGSLLTPVESELMAVALALIAWNESAPFSARDGLATSPALGGWARLDAQGREYFPRSDPVVIVLVEDGERLLLGSNLLWESGRFSLLAGFIEAGESAEQAVAREIWEESSLRVTDIRYVTSQPWPFPRSFMLGFRARPVEGADLEAIVPDPTELSELRWFTRDELREPPPGIRLPMPMSIARWLIDLWVAEG